MTGRGKGGKGLGKGGAKSHSPFWCFVITFRESPRCRIRGEPESSNWLVLYDQSEIIKMLMSARGVYKKSKIQAISVTAGPPPKLDRRRS